MGKKQRGRPPIEPKLYTFKGETKTMRQWSQDLNVGESTLRQRHTRFLNGEIGTLDEVFTPHSLVRPFEQLGGSLARNQGAKVGKRVLAIDALFTEFVKEGLPRLPDEMRHYMATGERGHAMQFFLAYKDFFPREKIEALDGEASKAMAAVAVVFQTEAPKDVTVIDQ